VIRMLPPDSGAIQTWFCFLAIIFFCFLGLWQMALNTPKVLYHCMHALQSYPPFTSDFNFVPSRILRIKTLARGAYWE
jgi:hypothetical protein